ncbi:hypothetical protein F3I62_19035 [Pseudomonas sp. R-28-1W-6]|uniref:hypothetical protein n=1 Tax=Pseudomonas sp. R-28-1W-6 TaxID=2650101 RepID=UPI001365EB9D|nr:hypothetical protein [Pseudomonas sp. R-28-1W-6]MWV14201.1 hypothetical protein [Pseudomonas sp. R-28-1W-6]
MNALKKALILGSIALSVAGCTGDGLRYQGMSGQQTTGMARDFMGFSPYRTAGLGRAVSLNLGTNFQALPEGSIFPAMKGKWQGVMENNDSTHTKRAANIYISGSTKKSRLKEGELNIMAVQNTCAMGFAYITTLQDGTVIYRKFPDWPGYRGVCGEGFLRVAPQDDGTLRISDHEYTPEGKEVAAGVFTRVPQ